MLPGTLPWWGWLTLAVVPPLIFLLYFLKLRRSPLEVPSTFLWKRAIEDMHVNSLWQRLRRNLLMFLQILFALMLLATCLRPGCQGTQLTGQRYIILVDHSSSMSATDSRDGRSRLETAKQQIRATVGQLPADTSVMLISFSDHASVVQSYTKNKQELLSRLESVGPTRRSSDLTEALAAASGLANPGRTSDRESSLDVQVADPLDATLLIYSDGGVRKIPQFAQGRLSPSYLAIGSVDDPPANVGITAFSVNDPAETDGRVQVFARLLNSDDEDRTVSVSLYVDDVLQDADAEIAIPAGQSKGIQFSLPQSTQDIASPVAVRLKIEQDDVYPQDNEAFCVFNPPTRANVLVVSESNPYFQFALATKQLARRANVEFQGADFFQTDQWREKAVLGSYDLVIAEGVVPTPMPNCNTLLFGAIPDGRDKEKTEEEDGKSSSQSSNQWQITGESSPTPVFDFDASHPVMAAVQMGSVTILKSKTVQGPRGSQSLVDSRDGSIAMIAPRESYRDLVFGFPIVDLAEDGSSAVNCDWPRKLSFPIFFQNVIDQLAGTESFSMRQTRSPGDPIEFRMPEGVDEVIIETPDGRSVREGSVAQPDIRFSETEATGIYQISNAATQEPLQMIAVNLLDPVESNLTVRPEMELGYSELKSVTTRVESRTEFWPWLLLVALIVLLIEWVIYNQRVFI